MTRNEQVEIIFNSIRESGYDLTQNEVEKIWKVYSTDQWMESWADIDRPDDYPDTNLLQDFGEWLSFYLEADDDIYETEEEDESYEE